MKNGFWVKKQDLRACFTSVYRERFVPPVPQRPGSSSLLNRAHGDYVAFQELLLPPSGKARLSQEQWGVEAAAFPLGRPALLPQHLEELALPLVRVPQQARELLGAGWPC